MYLTQKDALADWLDEKSQKPSGDIGTTLMEGNSSNLVQLLFFVVVFHLFVVFQLKLKLGEQNKLAAILNYLSCYIAVKIGNILNWMILNCIFVTE